MAKILYTWKILYSKNIEKSRVFATIQIKPYEEKGHNRTSTSTAITNAGYKYGIHVFD